MHPKLAAILQPSHTLDLLPLVSFSQSNIFHKVLQSPKNNFEFFFVIEVFAKIDRYVMIFI